MHKIWIFLLLPFLCFAEPDASNLELPERDYWREPTVEELDGLHFLVNTLAEVPEVSLIFYMEDLEAAGKTIRTLHPLKLLREIFGDEELKMQIRLIQEKRWVWPDFASGIGEFLMEEAEVGNIDEEMILDFVEVVHIEYEKFVEVLAMGDGAAVIDVLVENVEAPVCYVDFAPAQEYDRDYWRDANTQELKDIHYLVTTLADVPTASLLFYKSELTAAGDRIKPLHPLKFILAVFGDDLLKTKVKNIRGKSWVWGDFAGGFGDCLAEELQKNNVTRVMIDDLAGKIEVDPQLLYGPFEKADGAQALIVLMENVERNDDHDEYDF